MRNYNLIIAIIILLSFVSGCRNDDVRINQIQVSENPPRVYSEDNIEITKEHEAQFDAAMRALNVSADLLDTISGSKDSTNNQDGGSSDPAQDILDECKKLKDEADKFSTLIPDNNPQDIDWAEMGRRFEQLPDRYENNSSETVNETQPTIEELEAAPKDEPEEDLADDILSSSKKLEKEATKFLDALPKENFGGIDWAEMGRKFDALEKQQIETEIENLDAAMDEAIDNRDCTSYVPSSPIEDSDDAENAEINHFKYAYFSKVPSSNFGTMRFVKKTSMQKKSSVLVDRSTQLKITAAAEKKQIPWYLYAFGVFIGISLSVSGVFLVLYLRKCREKDAARPTKMVAPKPKREHKYTKEQVRQILNGEICITCGQTMVRGAANGYFVCGCSQHPTREVDYFANNEKKLKALKRLQEGNGCPFCLKRIRGGRANARCTCSARRKKTVVV